MTFHLKAVREALTPEWKTPAAKAVWLLRAWLVALAAFSLVVEPKYTTRPLLLATAGFGLAASVGFAFVPTRRPRTLKLAEFATLAAFALHMMGHTFGWYDAFAWYDNMLHFFVPLSVALILYALSQAAEWIWDWRQVSPLEVGIYLFSMSVAFGVLWEILEFGMDQAFGTEEQNGLTDTMVDLIMDTAGSLLGAVAAAIMTRIGQRDGHHEVSEEPKRPYPMRAPNGAAKE